jgi:hypothetical protein
LGAYNHQASARILFWENDMTNLSKGGICDSKFRGIFNRKFRGISRGFLQRGGYLICVALVLGLVACGPATATPAPTATAMPTEQPTSTEAPTEAPTATTAPTQPAASATPDANLTPTVAQNAAPPASGAIADKYQYLGQDIADHTQFLPNRTVTVTWTIKNIGTTGWTTGYTLRYFSGPKASKDVYPFSKEVPVNATINFTVTFKTPADPGDYDMWFKLTNNAGQNFGDLDLVYTVSNNPQKATSTPKP